MHEDRLRTALAKYILHNTAKRELISTLQVTQELLQHKRGKIYIHVFPLEITSLR